MVTAELDVHLPPFVRSWLRHPEQRDPRGTGRGLRSYHQLCDQGEQHGEAMDPRLLQRRDTQVAINIWHVLYFRASLSMCGLGMYAACEGMGFSSPDLATIVLILIAGLIEAFQIPS